MTVVIGQFAAKAKRNDIDVINYIISQVDAGVGCPEVARKLNDQGILTTHGKKWTRNNVWGRYTYWKPGDR